MSKDYYRKKLKKALRERKRLKVFISSLRYCTNLEHRA